MAQWTKLALGLVAGVIATAVIGGIAWATIPGSGGVYTACMLKNVGTVRVIDNSLPANNLMSHCKPEVETEISWNQQGPPGAPGSARAYGAIDASGQIYPQYSKNLTSVVHGITGTYCVIVDSSIDMNFSGGVVTPAGGAMEPRYAWAIAPCGSNGIAVNIRDGLTDQPIDSTFYLMIP